MKILLFLPDFRKGGAQAMIINLASHWVSEGHEVVMVAGTSFGGLAEKMDPSVTVVTGKGNGALSGFFPLIKIILQFKPDAILSALYHANIIASFASVLCFKKGKMRIVLSERNHLSASLLDLPMWKRFFMRALIHASYRMADSIIGISEGVCLDLEENFSMPFEKIRKIYNPVVTSSFSADVAEKVCHPWLENKDLPVIIAAGRLVPQKDYETMLHAFALLLKKRQARLIILGQGYLEKKLKNIAQTLGVSERVDFAGQVSSPLSYMAKADIFLLTSAWEGFGNVIVEALYCGLGIVATDCISGPSEILENGKYGILCPVKDVQSIANAILELLDHSSFHAPTQKARAEEFSAHIISRQYLNVLKGVELSPKTRKIQIVASKFPPEYSGPGVRIVNLYDDISRGTLFSRVVVYCNGVEKIKNETYRCSRYFVRRRTAWRLKSLNNNVRKLVSERIFQSLVYHVETLWGLWDLRHLSKKNTAYIHIFGHSGATSAAMKIGGWKGIPVLLELVNAQARPKQRFLGAWALPRNVYKIIAISDALAKAAQDDGIPKENIWSRPNPVNKYTFNYNSGEREEKREALNIFTTQDKIILYIAKFMPRKNQIFLPEILSHLPYEYKLVMAGPSVSSGIFKERDDAYIQDIIEYIKKYKLQDRVVIINDFVDSALYMKAADIYCIPSYNEGLGTPMLEAMSCGLPVICSKEEAFEQWIVSGKNGETLSMNAKLWAEKIKHYTETMTNEKRQKISEDILAHASMEHISKEYKNIFYSFMR